MFPQTYGAPFFERTRTSCTAGKDLLAKLDMAVPKTWRQPKADAIKIKDNGLAKYGFVWEGASYEGLTCNLMEYLGSAGARSSAPV